jgi:hypothetical protein
MTHIPCPSSRARVAPREYAEIIDEVRERREYLDLAARRIIADALDRVLTEDGDRYPERDFEG